MIKKIIIILGLVLVWGKTEKVLASDNYATIVNPVRSRELWKDKSLSPVKNQYEAIRNDDLKATWLLQDDVTRDKELVEEIKKFNEKQELGLFLEISSDLAKESRVYYPINRPWYSPEAVFLSGYERRDRIKLIDKMMADFKETFGSWPKSVGAWWIDSYSFQYLEKRYGIKTAMIVTDQKTTDSYGVWGQWWGYPYYPSQENILIPGNSRTLVIQWALRDPEKAYYGEGPKTSNYSLQANDYTSLGLDINYFKELAKRYFDQRNRLGQITVGLETGMESEGLIEEYKRQLDWIKQEGVEAIKMSEMEEKYRSTYGGNPEEIHIGEWTMTQTYRENNKLSERTDYMKEMSFRDYFEKDKSEFLNRIYRKENLINSFRAPYLTGAIILLLGLIIFMKLNWGLVGGGLLILKLIEHLRYSVVNGERILGFLIDNFRFIGITSKLHLMNQDLSNLVAQTMLKIEIKEEYYLGWLVGCLLICILYGRIRKTNKN